MSDSGSGKESSGGDNASATSMVAIARRLQEEFDDLKAKVLEMPEISEGMPVEQERRVADAKRAFWNKVLEREWVLERQRVREYVDEAKELGLIGPPDVIECPFCFDDISEDILKSKTAGNASEVGTIFPCCGKVCCLRCTPKLRLTSAKTCPFCRSKLGLSDKEQTKKIIKRAQNGDAVSQCKAGNNYANGRGVAEDMHQARYWFKQAALQGNTEAQEKLGMMYMSGSGGEQSLSESERFLRMAAKKSCPDAQRFLGNLMVEQRRNEEALQWFTLSASQGSIDAQKALAALHHAKGPESMMKNLYWCKKVALAGDEGYFYLTTIPLFFINLKRIGRDRFDFSTMVTEVGCNPIPEVLFWLRKATSAKESVLKVQAAKERKQYESMVRERCSGCWELAESFDNQLKACRCHAAFYCSKKCQIDHWKGGHVLDCYDKNGKFRPCPNDEKYN